MKTTYACYVGTPRRIELREREIAPAADQVLLKIAACGICRYDQHLMEHEPDQLVNGFGHEALGQVAACGASVKGFAEGDWAVGWIPFGFSSYSVAGEGALFHAPAELGDLACLAEPLKCVTTVVRAAKPDYGDTVAVVGCGFMGLASLSALAGNWTGRRIAIDMDAGRRKLAMAFGATHAIDPAAGDPAQAVRDLTGGRGADVAIEFAGSPRAATLAAKLLRYRGTLVLAGGHTPPENIYMQAITMHLAPPMFSPDERDDFRRTLDNMASGRLALKSLVSHRFTLSKIAQAFESAKTLGPAYMKGLVLNDLA